MKLKKHPKAISPSYKKYENAYNVIKELKFDGIIEREGSNFIISSIYYHDINNYGGYIKYLDALKEANKEKIEIKKSQKLNIELQNKELQYQETIRDRDEKISKLDLKLKRFEFIQKWWWLIGIILSIVIVCLHFLEYSKP